MTTEQIIANLPYAKPFLFVDEILSVDENGVEGTFTFDGNLDFYSGHFKGNPITPGAILTETMAQIGLACLGIYLSDNMDIKPQIGLTSSEMEYLKPVFPDEKVTVVSKKIYFRFGKLKCDVIMKNADGEEVCKGTIAGMIIAKP